MEIMDKKMCTLIDHVLDKYTKKQPWNNFDGCFSSICLEFALAYIPPIVKYGKILDWFTK